MVDMVNMVDIILNSQRGLSDGERVELLQQQASFNLSDLKLNFNLKFKAADKLQSKLLNRKNDKICPGASWKQDKASRWGGDYPLSYSLNLF